MLLLGSKRWGDGFYRADESEGVLSFFILVS